MKSIKGRDEAFEVIINAANRINQGRYVGLTDTFGMLLPDAAEFLRHEIAALEGYVASLKGDGPEKVREEAKKVTLNFLKDESASVWNRMAIAAQYWDTFEK